MQRTSVLRTSTARVKARPPGQSELIDRRHCDSSPPKESSFDSLARTPPHSHPPEFVEFRKVVCMRTLRVSLYSRDARPR
eukprot:2707719-Amphidinium_carterae.1